MPNGKNKPQIIGLAGTFASGKDTLAKQLVNQFGYNHVSTSDMVRSAALEEHGSIERPVLQTVATHHRHTDGPGYFATRALREDRPLIISGLRSMGEVDAVRAAGGVIVFVDAPIQIRYERMKSRNRDREVDVTLETFTANEQNEWHVSDDPADFNLRDIKQTADIVIENQMSLDDFIDAAYKSLGL